jgi:hypothetical protein
LFSQITSLTTASSTTSGVGINTVEIEAGIEVNVGGKIAIQGAQATANASNTIFQRGSFMTAFKSA